MHLTKKFAAPFLAVLVSFPAAAQTPTPDLQAAAGKAYTFAYPMVLMEFTRRAAVERSGISGAQGGMNRFNHALEFPTERFRQVIRPNADTLYSSSWIDL